MSFFKKIKNLFSSDKDRTDSEYRKQVNAALTKYSSEEISDTLSKFENEETFTLLRSLVKEVTGMRKEMFQMADNIRNLHFYVKSQNKIILDLVNETAKLSQGLSELMNGVEEFENAVYSEVGDESETAEDLLPPVNKKSKLN